MVRGVEDEQDDLEQLERLSKVEVQLIGGTQKSV